MYCMIASDFGHRTSPHEITPLPAGISQDEYIRRLRRQCDMEADHIAELKEQVRTIALERDAAREKVARIMAGLEGCCMTCEPVGMRNQQMERDIETLKDQRDEARRDLCMEWVWRGRNYRLQNGHKFKPSAKDWATISNWDCFRDTMKQP
jgi:hypothetical protein